jgi:hypothetical protein
MQGVEGVSMVARRHRLKDYARSERLKAWKTALIVGDEHIHLVDPRR